MNKETASIRTNAKYKCLFSNTFDAVAMIFSCSHSLILSVYRFLRKHITQTNMESGLRRIYIRTNRKIRFCCCFVGLKPYNNTITTHKKTQENHFVYMNCAISCSMNLYACAHSEQWTVNSSQPIRYGMVAYAYFIPCLPSYMCNCMFFVSIYTYCHCERVWVWKVNNKIILLFLFVRVRCINVWVERVLNSTNSSHQFAHENIHWISRFNERCLVNVASVLFSLWILSLSASVWPHFELVRLRDQNHFLFWELPRIFGRMLINP